MKLKKCKLKVVLMITVIASILFANKVFGYTLNVSQNIHPYMYDAELFCVNYPKGLQVKNVPGIDNNTIMNNYAGRVVDLESSIGFAFYTASKTNNWNAGSLQEVVWASGQFAGEQGYINNLAGYDGRTTSPSSNDVLIARSNQFAQFYYGILKGRDQLNINVTNNSSKILVDQFEGKYIAGPYKVDVNCGNLSSAVQNAKEVLYNELSGVYASAYPGTPAFATASLSGINGSEIEFLDKSGNAIKFPNWGEDFYIRFRPSNGVMSINPKITVNYIPEVKEKVTYYEGNNVTFSGTVSNILVRESEFNISNYVYAGTIKQNGNPGASVKINATETSRTTTIVQEIDGYEPIDPKNPSKGQKPRYKSVRYVTGFSYTARLDDPTRVQELIHVIQITEPARKDIVVDLGIKNIKMELGGNVWEDLPELKTGDITGKRSDEDKPYSGIEVRLYEKDVIKVNNVIEANLQEGRLVATAITDKDGKYHFTGLNPLKKYYVRFTFNGEIYQSTYYKNSLIGGYSNAVDEGREAFNNKFGKIDSTSKNYKVGNEWHKSYALYAKLQKDNGEFISIKSEDESYSNINAIDKTSNKGALTYVDAWNKFVSLVSNSGRSVVDINSNAVEDVYAKVYEDLKAWLSGYGVGNEDREGVITFIKDSMITSVTHVQDPLQNGKVIEYPVYNSFILENITNPTENVETVRLDKTYSYLYTKKSDQSRYVDFGLNRRESQELYLQKDVFKATVVVNGKKHDYEYSKKNLADDGSWSIEIRAGDALYNGDYAYTREVRKSEYLYVGDDSEIQGIKNMQVYVTYRIAIKNRSQTLSSSVNEIVDFYDAKQYTFDGELQSNGTYSKKSYNTYDENGNVTGSYVNSYVGSDANGNKLNDDLVISNGTSFADRDAKKTLLNGEYDSLYLTGIKSASGNDRLNPGEFAYVYVTFKVNNDPATGKVMLDQDLETGNTTIGKRNIAEINGYSTYYRENASVPGYLEADDSTIVTPVQGKTAGIIDTLSNAGNLADLDLDANGNLIRSTNPIEDRTEMDTDSAPNIKLVISQNDEDTRKMTGYVYEDERTVENDKAVVGNGKYDDGETKINGVKVELVELVAQVDANGTFVGTYKGEKVWGSKKYKLENGKLVVDGEEDFSRYFSGIGTSKVILSGPGILKVSEDTGLGDGEYSFKSVPAGDFFIRFTYGDNTQTVLTSGDNEVNNLIGAKGLNAKSYNGQDYKSTTYQAGVVQDSRYNGINGFTNYDVQNYNGSGDKASMYFYDIAKSGAAQGVSDAKDVYSFREKANNWSKGAKEGILLNNRAEVLNSFESIGTYRYNLENEEASTSAQKEAQIAKINELIENTQMVAQTGIIDTEIEFNSTNTKGQGSGNRLSYIISDIDLGLEQRPLAQLKLNKEISNFKLALVNNQIVFDTTQSVNNLYFSKHDEHSATYKGYRLTGYEMGKNTKEMPELLQAYLDEELIAGASIQVTYKLTAQNVGEVDYLDKQFYYTGKSAHPNDTAYMSKTSATSVIDYVSNLIKFDKNNQEVDSSWQVRDLSSVLPSSKIDAGNVVIDETKLDSDLVNRQYFERLSTYNTIITTDKLSGELLPTLADKNQSEKSTTLVLSTLLSNTSGVDDFIYNNLSEITGVSNSQGRRMAYSVQGNQEMSDQSLGSNASEDVYTTLDLVTPKEIDADSAQKIVILPPTGENRNYVTIIATILSALAIVIAGVVVTKKIMKK